MAETTGIDWTDQNQPTKRSKTYVLDSYVVGCGRLRVFSRDRCVTISQDKDTLSIARHQVINLMQTILAAMDAEDAGVMDGEEMPKPAGNSVMP